MMMPWHGRHAATPHMIEIVFMVAGRPGGRQAQAVVCKLGKVGRLQVTSAWQG